MARPELGTKRVCEDCSAKFYDLNRDPITCPKCGTIFEVEKLTQPVVAEPEEPEEEEVVVEADASAEDDDAEVISLEDADAEQASDIVVPDVDDDSGDDADVFLEDEEDEEALGAIGLDVAVPTGDEE